MSFKAAVLAAPVPVNEAWQPGKRAREVSGAVAVRLRVERMVRTKVESAESWRDM